VLADRGIFGLAGSRPGLGHHRCRDPGNLPLWGGMAAAMIRSACTGQPKGRCCDHRDGEMLMGLGSLSDDP